MGGIVEELEKRGIDVNSLPDEEIDKIIEATMKKMEEGEPKPEPQPQPEPVQSYPEPPAPTGFTKSEEAAMDMLSEMIAKRKGMDPRAVRAILEELARTEDSVMRLIREFSTLARSMSNGEISSRIADAMSARVLGSLGGRLARRITGSTIDISEVKELILLRMLEKLLSEDSQPRENRIRMPLIDPETGEPMRDRNGNIIYVEYVVGNGSVPIIPPMPVKTRKVRELEEKIRELERRLSGESEGGQGPITTFITKLSERIATKLGDEAVKRIVESGRLDEFLELVEEQALAALGASLSEEVARKNAGKADEGNH